MKESSDRFISPARELSRIHAIGARNWFRWMFARSAGWAFWAASSHPEPRYWRVAAMKNKAPRWKSAARLNIPRSCGINSALQLHRSG